ADGSGPAGLPDFLVALATVSLLLGFGQNTPVFPFLYRYIPTFNLFQAPTRILIWLEFALALLAGLGAARRPRPQGRGLYWTRLGTAGAAAVALVGLTVWLGLSATGILQTLGRALAQAGLSGGIAAVLWLTQPSGQRRPWWVALVVVFVAADLFWAGI